jgi:HAD superfamily hydrolase (TIGR01490 family)
MGRANIDFIENAVKHIAGIEQKVLEEIAGICFASRIKTNIYKGALELIKEAQGRGEEVLFATTSFHTLIKPLEDFFGISGSIASSLEFSGGKTTGRLAGESLFGAKKKNAVERWLAERSLGPKDLRFYSDSYTDLPLLAYCGEAIVVNPDRFLEKEAKKRGWPVLHFRETLASPDHL